jgi:hypothetical protein
MQPIYLNTYKIYILNAKVMKKNESAKKKRDYFALSLALAAGRHAGICTKPLSSFPSKSIAVSKFCCIFAADNKYLVTI